MINTETARGQNPFRKEKINQSEIMNARNIPTKGAIIIKEAVFKILGSLAMLRALNPPWAMAAPDNPPINV